MARNDWTALVTSPGSEYLANSELLRFGLRPYLPQVVRSQPSRHHGAPRTLLTRAYPLFPRYLLLPFQDLKPHTPAIFRLCRGLLTKPGTPLPLLAAEDGTPWRCPNHIIEALKTAEQQAGISHNNFKNGDKFRPTNGVLADIPLILEQSTHAPPHHLMRLFSPLLGGAFVKTTASTLTKI